MTQDLYLLKTGVAPVETIAETVGTAVFATVITSSHGLFLKAVSPRKSAAVPL